MLFLVEGGIIGGMRVVESSIYSKWFNGLRDRVAKARIDRRIKRAARGDYGESSESNVQRMEG